MPPENRSGGIFLKSSVMDIVLKKIDSAELKRLKDFSVVMEYSLCGFNLLAEESSGMILSLEPGGTGKNPLPEKIVLATDFTDFQLKTYEALLNTNSGETVTYSELARRMGCERAVRAVANAVAGNRFAIAIPCHRVVPKNGKGYGNYRWGKEMKRLLINSEAESCQRNRADENQAPESGSGSMK